MNKQALAAKIWESANRMRSKIEANEYKDYILGFIFYKFLSDNEVRYLKDTDWTDEYLPELTEEDDETVKSVQQNIGYFISYDNLFSTWIQKGADFSAGDVTDALSAFDRLINPAHEKVFSGIFTTLQTGLSKLGETSDAKTKAIRGLIDLIKDIPMNGKQDYDVLGFIYEYLLSNFAANAGKKAGEFYTPHEVSLLMSEIVANHLQNRKQIEIYDPPYNTGNDFIYEDDFSQSIEEYARNSGQQDEEGNRLVQNSESNGRFHTDWLNMIFPRLRLAKDMLSDDGLIFISIDDNERENLKKICDEVFGSKNYINQFAWVSNITGRQIAGIGAAKTWESVIVYAKNAPLTTSMTVDIKFAKNNMPDSYKGFSKDIRTDKLGDFAVGDTLYNHNRKFNEETRPNLVFSIFYNPSTKEIITGDIGERKDGFIELPPHKNGDGVHKYHAWRWSKQKITNENYNLIVLPNSSDGYEIYTKIRDFNNTLLKDIITNIPNGDSEVRKLFDNQKLFDYPKSVNLLRLFIDSI